MKKKVFSLMMTLLLAFMGVAKAETVEIGTGSSGTTYYVPFNSLYGYSFTEQVYTASEIGAAGNITSISFNLAQSYTSEQTNQIALYMKNVTRSSFSSTTDYEAVTAGDIVYSGMWTIPANYTGWVTVTLDTPFAYDGTSNLLVAMHESTSGYSTRYFTYDAVTNGAVQWYSDSYNPDPYNLGSYSGSSYTRSYRNNIQLDIVAGGGGVSYEAQIGEGTGTSSYFPFYTLYNYSIGENLFLASELTAAGVLPGEVTSLSWYATNQTGYEQQGISIWMANVNDTQLTSSSHVTTGMTLVYTGSVTPVTGWNEFPCNAGTFTWDGTSNILIFCQRNNGAWNSTISWQAGTTDFTSSSYQYQDSAPYDVTVSNSMSTSSSRSNIIIKGVGAGEDSLVWDFEDGTMQGWTTIDADGDGYDWMLHAPDQVYTEDVGHEGSDYYVYSQSYNSDYGALTPDNYFVSPQVQLGGTFSFWAQAQDPDWPEEHFGVAVSTTSNTSASAFTMVPGAEWTMTSSRNGVPGNHKTRSGNRTNQPWYQYTVDLSAYSGMGYVAIRHFDCTDMFYLNVDDIELTAPGEGPTVEYIDLVEINDFVAPVWGEPVTQDVTIPEDANYSLMAATWFTLPHGVFPGREINPDPIYNLDEMDYIWGFIMLPNEGYVFNPNLAATINGSSDLVLLAAVVTPEAHEAEPELPVGAAVVYTYAYYTYEEGLHTLSTYGVGEDAYESIDRLIIERPNGAWMEPYHFNLYNDGDEDVEVVLIDFLHNNGYFSMDEETTEYPFTVAANGRPGVDLYINTDFDWTDTEEINSLLAVNTSERSTHLYQIVAAPYTPYCPDVVEAAYPLGNVTDGLYWRHSASWMWNEINPEPEYEIHDNYTLPFPEVPEGNDVVIKFTVDRAMSLNARVPEEYENGKVALYTEDFYGENGPMADNNYTERPMQGGGSTPAGGAFEAVIGDGTSTTGYMPFYCFYNYSMSQQLFLAAELQAAGVTSAPMTSLSWYCTNTNGNLQSNITIWMANVEETAIGGNSIVTSGMTKVYTGNMTPTVGWDEFVFNQGNFAWDGHSNILISVQRNNGDWASGISWQCGTQSFTASGYSYNDSQGAYNMETNSYVFGTSGSSYGGTTTSRSNIKMKGGNRNRDAYTYGFENGLDGWTALDVNVDGGTWIHSDDNLGQYDYTTVAHGGTGFAMCYSFVDYDGAYDTDSYLISPQQYTLDNNSSITFWADNANDSYPESFSVCVSTAANPTASSFTQVWGGNAKAGSNGNATVRHTNDRYDNWRSHTVNLSAYAGQTVWIAFHDVNYDAYEIWIDDVTINAASSTPVDPDQPVDPEVPGAFAAFSAGPVIENLNILPGTYYLVASSTATEYYGPRANGDDFEIADFEVEIGIQDLPCPEKAVVVAPVDNAEGIQPNSVTLKWLLDPNCTEYRLTFSTTYWPDDEVETHPQTILVDWTNDLAEEYTVTNLWNNTNYFWRVDQRTNGGEPDGCTTIGDIWGFTTHFNVPGNLTATPVELFEGQTTTLNWNSIVDRTYRYYFIYKDDEYLDRTTVNQVNLTTYTVAATELPYNMDGYKFNVTAIYDEGESAFSNDAIVKVSGYTNETGINGYAYEQDGVTPIGGVTVTITGTDEFNHEHTYTATTDENGYYHVQVYVGNYTVAVANKDGYQETTTTHALPFDAPHQGQVNDVNFIMDEVFYAPANVCAETVEVGGEELVKIWWDFNFYNEMVEDFETGDLSQFDWETTANYPWTITTTNPYEGTYCLKSGGAGVNNVVSDLNLTVEIPNDGILSFFIKPSCESNWDYGHFYLDGTEMSTFTGAGNWGEKRYPVTEGEHTLRWSYTKDGSVNSNDDCVYLDYIRFNLLPEPPIAGDTYDFDDSSMQGWTTIDADGDGFNWDMASNLMSGVAGHNGSADFVFSQSYSNDYGVLYPDNYFVSPQVQLGGQVRFYACAQDASYAAEHFGVAVSTTGNTSASAFTTVQQWTLSAKSGNNGKPVGRSTRSGRAQGEWYEFNVDLSAYAGQTGYVAIRHFNCSDMFYLDVDDITIADPNRGVAEVEPTRSLNHFNVYRTDCYNDGPYNSDNTEFLSTVWLPDTAYFDVSWIDAAPGVYKWGVSAVYAGNQADNPNNPRIDYPFEERESEITWHTGCAPCIDKDMYILDGVTINVVLNSADSPEGTVVTFENTNPGEQALHPMEPLVLDQTGYYVFPEFRKGNYNITVEKDGYFTQLDYQEIWTPMDLRYVLIEKIFNARELYVSRTGWAMWQPNGTLSNPEDDPMRHLEGYKIMCTSIDGEPIFNENTPAEQPFCQVATADLVEGEHYICKVAAIYSTGMSDYIEAEWQYEPCEHYAGVVDGVVNVEGSTISWEYPGGGVGPTPPPAGDASTFSFGFEEGMPEGWTTIDGNNDGYTWCMTSDIPSTWTYYAGMDLTWYHNGTNAICSGSYINGVGAITPNDYLVSPLLTLAAGSQLSFWVAACDESYPADHFGVFVSDDAANWTSVQEWTLTAKRAGVLGPWSQAAPKAAVAGDRASRDGNGLRVGTWYNYTVDLSEYAGQKYIAFRHFNCNDQYIMCLDDVALTAGAKAGDRDGILQYSTETFDGGVGTGGGAVYWGIRFPAADLAAYVGQNLTKVGIFTDVDGDYGWTYSGTYTANVYLGGETAPGTLVSTAQEYLPGDLAWHDITLTTPVAIDGTQDLWLTFYTPDIAYPMSGCTYVGNSNSDFLSLDGTTWEHSTDYDLDYTWMIRGTVEGGVTPPVPPTEGDVIGAMIFVDGEWEAYVEYPTNEYTYEGDGQEICVRVIYNGDAELPENNYYFAMSCGDCVGGIEPQPECPFDATLTYEVNDTDDQVNLFWGEQPEPPVPAEGTTFTYDFENGSLDGLTTIDADADGYGWMANTTFGGHGGSTGIAYSQSYDNNYGVLYPDNFLVFPVATIVEGSTFSLWACGQDAGYAAEHFGVAVSSDGTTGWTMVNEWTIGSKTAKAARDGRDQSTWTQYTVDLSDYAGEEIYIAIRHFNCSDMFYLDIDDVELSIAAKSNRDGIIGYNIYRSTDGISFDLIGTVAGDVYEYTDAPGAGSYYYYVTAVYEGCESAPTNTVQVGVTGVGDLSDNVNLFPNPTKGNVTIQAKDMNRITVVSVLGQVVFDTELDQDEYILNMAQFNTGMYMVRIYTDGGVTVKRVTVMH